MTRLEKLLHSKSAITNGDYLQDHLIEVARNQRFLEHWVVSTFCCTAILGKCEQFLGHVSGTISVSQSKLGDSKYLVYEIDFQMVNSHKEVELLHVVIKMNANRVPMGGKR